jgi:alginate O-acetyltransferase complex protein AlgI
VLFNSYLFLVAFLPTVLVGFIVACRIGRRVALLWLTAASLTFYAWWGLEFLPLLLASVAGNFALARLIGRMAGRPRMQLVLLTGGIAIDFSVLAWDKFAGTVLPPGISFFTFTQIGYLLDRSIADDPSATA